MYLSAVKYKDGSFFAPGSKCFELLELSQKGKGEEKVKANKDLEVLVKKLDAEERWRLEKVL